MVEGLIRDLRFTIRNMDRSPAVALVIALSLGLGIGANTAIFSLIRSVLVKSLPVQDPDRLVLLHWFADEWPRGLNQSGSGGPDNPAYKAASRSLAYPFFQSIADSTSVFDSVFAFAPLGSERRGNTTLAADGTAERVDGEMISGDSFRGLGVRPAIGRSISIDDERADAQVAVISYAYWTRRFGSGPVATWQAHHHQQPALHHRRRGARAVLRRQPGRSPEVFIRMVAAPQLAAWGFSPAGTQSLLAVRGYWWAHVIARLKPGVSEAQARGDR